MFKPTSRSPSPTGSISHTSQTGASTSSASTAESSKAGNPEVASAKRRPDDKDAIETPRHTGIPRAPTPEVQRHFSALNLGGGRSSTSMPVRGGSPSARPQRTQAEIDAGREARKAAQAARKQAAKEKEKEKKPFTAKDLHNFQVEAHGDVAKKVDKDDRHLERFPSHKPLAITDRKIHKYLFDTTHKEGPAKANAFEALGHPVGPGGTPYPMTKDMFEHGERLKSQINDAVKNRPAFINREEEVKVREYGQKFTVATEIGGIGRKKGKSTKIETVWIDSRQPDESGNYNINLTTLIAKGKKE